MPNCLFSILLTSAALLGSSGALAQSPAAPVCTGNRYGTPAQAQAIERALQSGTVAESVAAIRAAQATRAGELGCAEANYALAGNNYTAPSVLQVRASWAVHVASADQAIAQLDRCPAIGRGPGAYALGGWIGRSAGLSFPEAPLSALADNFVGTQYGADKTPGEVTTWSGLYGYATRYGNSTDTCFIDAILAAGINSICAQIPSACISYVRGRFANERFVVADFSASAGLRDGGAAFDQGWAGLMMIEAALGAGDRVGAERYRASALAAADWAVAEPAVRNHNYTAKLIWLLAASYDWTGDARYKNALVDKLERSLLPGVLMDQNADGEIDGVPGLRFASLNNPAARIPGRMWDAHNALPWYQAMNAIALVEAYAAFNARGDVQQRDRVRPYALAMLNNQAAEFLSGAGSAGNTQAGYAFASALWKLDADASTQQNWQKALWGIWNTGLSDAPGDSKTAIAAIVSARVEGKPWRSYRSRGAVSAATPALDSRISGHWYDQGRSGEGLTLTLIAPNRMLATWYTYTPDTSGAQLWLLADGSFDGRRFEGVAQITQGARFGANFNPLSVVRQRWGILEVDFASCDAAKLTWRADSPSFGTGSINLVRLAGTADLNCR